ncbi:hypothetical protein [Amycolatopsis silviterrae]|uniref:Uncharacterized protein n=1 Tax=Amycolatopsis silviterrae TaxID=1656914 RepID=A0ABW5H750_9PSEU
MNWQRKTVKLGGTAALLGALVVLSPGVAAAGVPPAAPGDVAAAAKNLNCAVPPTRDLEITKLVYRVGLSRNVSDKVMLAAFETGWVESHMNNLNCGDLDSLGVFQQRPSAGWGTPEQIMNPEYAATQFFSHAQANEPRYPNYTAGQLAQSVQISKYGEKYDLAESIAVAMLDEVRGSVQPPPGDAGIAASASYRYGSQEHMFSRGADGSLLHSYNTGEQVESESYPGELVGEPVALVSGDVQHVFALLTGDRLGHWFWRPDDADPVFEVAATDIGGNPSGYAFGDQVHVLARGTDNRLRHIYWTPQNTDVVEESAEQELSGDPVAYVWHDQQHVFARTPDGQLGHWWWTPADNEPQYTTWGGQIAGNPAGYAVGDQQHVYARTPEGTLAHYYWTPQDGVQIEPLPQTLTGDPVAYVWNDQQHVFARTPDDQLGHWWWTPEDNEPHYVSWGGNLGANPTGFATPAQQNVYGRTTDGVLTHWYWTPDMAAPDIETWGQ